MQITICGQQGASIELPAAGDGRVQTMGGLSIAVLKAMVFLLSLLSLLLICCLRQLWLTAKALPVRQQLNCCTR